MPEATPTSDFDAAKKIVDELKDLSKERQERVLRWVSESIGIVVFSGGATPLSGAGAVGAAMPIGETNSSSSGVALGGRDIRSFVAQKAPTSDNQFAAVVAYYYRFEAPPTQRKNTIGGADLQEAARLAGRKRLSNPRQTLKHAKNMGYLDNVDRGAFSINTVGENLVAMTLPSGADTGQQQAGKRIAKSRSKARVKAKGRAKKGR
jgi:hypothetical protein